MRGMLRVLAHAGTAGESDVVMCMPCMTTGRHRLNFSNRVHAARMVYDEFGDNPPPPSVFTK